MTSHRIHRRIAALSSGLAAAVILTAAPTALAGSAAPATTPDRAERQYQACIAGAPITPDSHERWVASCRELVRGG